MRLAGDYPVNVMACLSGLFAAWLDHNQFVFPDEVRSKAAIEKAFQGIAARDDSARRVNGHLVIPAKPDAKVEVAQGQVWVCWSHAKAGYPAILLYELGMRGALAQEGGEAGEGHPFHAW